MPLPFFPQMMPATPTPRFAVVVHREAGPGQHGLNLADMGIYEFGSDRLNNAT